MNCTHKRIATKPLCSYGRCRHCAALLRLTVMPERLEVKDTDDDYIIAIEETKDVLR